MNEDALKRAYPVDAPDRNLWLLSGQKWGDAPVSDARRRPTPILPRFLPQERTYPVDGCINRISTLYQLIAASLSAQCPLQASNLIHRDFRAGDVRHSLASISKAQGLLGYVPAVKIDAGIMAAMPWYIRKAAAR